MQINYICHTKYNSLTLGREVDVIEVSYTITVINRFIIIRTAEFYSFLLNKYDSYTDYFEKIPFEQQCNDIKEFLNFINK